MCNGSIGFQQMVGSVCKALWSLSGNQTYNIQSSGEGGENGTWRCQWRNGIFVLSDNALPQAELVEEKEAAEARHNALEAEHATLSANAATLADATLKAQARGTIARHRTLIVMMVRTCWVGSPVEAICM